MTERVRCVNADEADELVLGAEYDAVRTARGWLVEARRWRLSRFEVVEGEAGKHRGSEDE